MAIAEEPPRVVHVWLLSGIRLQSVPWQDTELEDVLSLKLHLEESCGLPTCVQEMLQGNIVLDNTTKLSSLAGPDIQLALVPLEKSTPQFYQGMFMACARGLVEAVRLLIAAKADVNHCQVTAFTKKKHRLTSAIFEACQGGALETVQLLLEARANPNCITEQHGPLKESPLTAAVHRGYLDVSRLLLRFGASPSFMRQHAGSSTSMLFEASQN